MVRWDQINPVLLFIFSRIAVNDPPARNALPANGVPWAPAWKDRKEASNYVDPKEGHSLLLKVISCEAPGNDTIREYGEAVVVDGEEVERAVEEVSGQRVFVLRLESDVPADNSDTLSPLTILERIRTRLNRSWVAEALDAVGVSLIDYGRTQDFTTTRNKRQVVTGFLDITFGVSVLETFTTDEFGDPLGWIEHVELSSEFTGTAQPAPAPPNFTNDIIPPFED